VVGIAGRNLIIGDKGWFLEGSTGSDEEMYGDLAVPLEMDDEVRGDFTEWLLYRDGEVVTTVTDDQIDIDNDALLGVSSSTLSNPIGANVRPHALALPRFYNIKTFNVSWCNAAGYQGRRCNRDSPAHPLHPTPRLFLPLPIPLIHYFLPPALALACTLFLPAPNHKSKT
jgi:hypothetical protein